MQCHGHPDEPLQQALPRRQVLRQLHRCVFLLLSQLIPMSMLTSSQHWLAKCSRWKYHWLRALAQLEEARCAFSHTLGWSCVAGMHNTVITAS